MRRLLCVPCGHDYKLHPLDAVDGFKMRKVQGLAKKPEIHNIKITTMTAEQTTIMERELPALLCDLCGKAIFNGTPAVAVTMWREHEIGPWESEYFAPPVEQSQKPT